MPTLAPPLVVFLLVFARISSTLTAAPIYGEQALPTPVRIGLSALIAAIFTPAQVQLAGPIAPDAPTFIVLIGQQVLLGLAFALIFTVVFRAGEAAGEIIGQQMGITLSGWANPGGDGEMHSIAQLYHVLAGLIFLALDGQHWVLLSLGASLNAMPVTRVALTSGLLSLLQPLGASAIEFALGLALPLLATSLLADLVTGLLNRAMPSLNLFVLGLPLKVALILAGLGIAAPFTVAFIMQTMRQLPMMGLWH
jgi:flagellar biosynthesis protein FliR